MTTTLGISLGTRSIGIAVLRDGELLDWKVQCFKGYWSKYKCSLIAGTIAKHIKLYSPNRVAIKTPAEARPSPHLKKLIAILGKQLSGQQLPLYCYTLTDLKRCVGCRSKHELIAAVAGQYPELFHTYQKLLRYRNGYYDKCFEAIACAELCGAITHK